MKKVIIASAAVVLFAVPVAGFSHQTDDPKHDVYWHDSKGVYVKDGIGECVKGKDWYAGSQIEGCDEIKKMAMPAPMPGDADGDGVTDDKDHCPNTPAGAPVDRDGCPKDSDRDGVADYEDQCPNTVAGAKVDAKGCEIKSMVLMEVNLNVNFATNSDVITSAYNNDIKRVADFMMKSEGSKVYIEGHTDSTGAEAYNQELSQRRADAVARELVSKYGISSNRVVANGFGETQPIADNSTSEGRRENRRVVAVVKGMVKK